MARIPLSVREMAILRALVVTGGTSMEWDNRFDTGPSRQVVYEETVNEMAARGMVKREPIKGTNQTGEKGRNVVLTSLGFLCLQDGHYETGWDHARPTNDDVETMLLTWFDSVAKMARTLFPVSDEVRTIAKATTKAVAPLKLKTIAFKA